MPIQIDAIHGLISTDTKSQGVISDAPTEIAERKFPSRTVVKFAVFIGLAGIGAVTWVTAGCASLPPCALLVSLLVTSAAFSTELLFADDSELALWGWALCLEHGAVQISSHAELGQATGALTTTLPRSSMVHDDATRWKAEVLLSGFSAENLHD